MEANSVSRTPTVTVPRSRRLLAALSDERLVEQVRRGNDAAFEAIYDRHSRGILGFCRHMLASAEEAEDAVQHTFIQAHGAIGRSDRAINLKPWLYTIARNRCLSILRARREQTAELDDIPTAGLSDEVERRADLRELLGDIRALPEEQRAALVLSEVGDLSHSDIATVVGCEVKKVKALVYQARSSLIETRNARETPCHEIREQLATATGGVLRRAPLRRHLKQCDDCTRFRDGIRRQRAMLAAALPVFPSLALKKSALAAIGMGGGAGGAGAAGGGAGGGLATLIGSGGVAKTVAVVTLAGATAAGGIALTTSGGAEPPRAQAAQAPAQPAAPAPATAENARYASARSRHHGPAASTRHVKRHHGAANGAAKPKKHGHGHSSHGAGGTRAHGNGHGHALGRSSQPPPASTPTTPHANENAGSHPPATAPPSDGSSGNPGRHLGSQNGNGNAYGHQGTPAQPPAKPEDAGPPADPGNSGTAPGQVKPDKPLKEK